jgi:hypothetical protein
VRVLLEDLRSKVEPEWEAAYRAALEGLGKARLLAHPDYGGLALRLRGETLSLGGAAPEGLEEHQEKVAGVLLGFLGRLDLEENLSPDMEEAARKHDLGKLDPRFQTWLRLTAPAEEGFLRAPWPRAEPAWARGRWGPCARRRAIPRASATSW